MVTEVFQTDDDLLGVIPDYLSISQMLKATPATEGANRFVYLEASNEAVDQQNEVVLAKALADSADFYLKFGNLDIDHYTQIGPKQGIPGYELYEIGRPVDVRIKDGRTFVKGQIYSGTGAAADKANAFWSSLTELSPPARWYPSVGGAVLEKGIEIDPATRSRRAVIRKVRWSNVGFSKTPVNPDLATVSTVPFGALAKSFAAGGFDWLKALEAGHVTDSAALVGGGALRMQSLDVGQVFNYWDFRDRFSKLVKPKELLSAKAGELVRSAQRHFGLAADVAAEYVERFISDIRREIAQRSKK